MNRYATNNFDFIRGWRNAAGSRVITEAGQAQLATPIAAPLSVNLVATPAPISSATVSAPVTSAPISSNTSSGSGGGGGSRKDVAEDVPKTTEEPVTGGSVSVGDKVRAAVNITFVITGLILIGMNAKQAFK